MTVNTISIQKIEMFMIYSFIVFDFLGEIQVLKKKTKSPKPLKTLALYVHQLISLSFYPLVIQLSGARRRRKKITVFFHAKA